MVDHSTSSELVDVVKRTRDDILHEVKTSIPQLGVSMELVPGEYWFFHPGWFNSRWWWEEIIKYAGIVQESVVSALFQYVHLREIDQTQAFLSEKHKAALRRMRRDTTFAAYYDDQVKMRDRSVDDAITRIFSLREKVSWLCFSIVGATSTRLNVPPHMVSYHQTLNTVRKSTPPPEYEELVSHLKRSFERLDNGDFRILGRIRNGIVHRSRGALGETPSPMILPMDDDNWDSIDLGGVRSRQLIHLIVSTLVSTLTSIRQLARMPWPTLPFRLMVTEDSDLTPNINSIVGRMQLVHSGIATTSDYGPMTVRCMKLCDGFIGHIDLVPGSDFNNPDLRQQLFEQSSRLIKAVVPEYEPERASSHSACFLTNDSKHFIQLMRKVGERFSKQGTASDIVDKNLEVQIDDSKYEWKWVDRNEGLRQANQTHNWPREVRETIADELVTKGHSSKPPFGRQHTGWKHAKYHVIFPGKVTGQMRRLADGQSLRQLMFFEMSEVIQSGQNHG